MKKAIAIISVICIAAASILTATHFSGRRGHVSACFVRTGGALYSDYQNMIKKFGITSLPNEYIISAAGQRYAYPPERNTDSKENSGKTVAFFHISSADYVVARKSNDYVSKMIELAGGNYVFEDLGDPETNTATITIEMETFFATAKDADYLIYNGTIDQEIRTIDDLLAKNALLAEFKAVQTGNVWCTNQNMYQETTQLGQVIQSFHLIFSGEADDLDTLPFVYRLR